MINLCVRHRPIATLSRFLVAGLLLVLSAFSCGERKAEFIIEHASIREMPPGTRVASAYLVIRNNSDDTLFLNGVSSNLSDRIEVHRTVYDQGNMQMREVQHLVIEPRQKLEFTPGGYHLMLMGVEKRLVSGDALELSFDFQGHPAYRVKAQVKRY